MASGPGTPLSTPPSTPLRAVQCSETAASSKASVAVPKLVMPPGQGGHQGKGAIVSPPGLSQPPGLSMPGKGKKLPALSMPGKGVPGNIRPKVVDPAACASLGQNTQTKFDMSKLCRDIQGLANLSSSKWKAGCTEVYNRIMTGKGLENHIKECGDQGKQQFAQALLSGFEHFQGWQKDKLKGRLRELLGENTGGSKGKGKPAQKQGGKGWNTQEASSSWKDKEKPSWKDKKEKPNWKDKLKRGFGRRNPDKTGANAIDVKWKPPEKEKKDEKKEAAAAAPAMSAAPSAPSYNSIECNLKLMRGSALARFMVSKYFRVIQLLP